MCSYLSVYDILEYIYIYTLCKQGTVDFAEFIALELMRMGKVEPSTLGLIKVCDR